MPNNVLGYNRTSTSYRGKIHDIHLRLRRPGSHELIDYESIAATMCHELAHCVRGPHDAHFYKVNILFLVVYHLSCHNLMLQSFIQINTQGHGRDRRAVCCILGKRSSCR